jgi:hypothetical protein
LEDDDRIFRVMVIAAGVLAVALAIALVVHK